MIVNILANMAIIFMDIYLVWRWRYSIEIRRNPVTNRNLFIGLQTVAGIALMMASFIVEGVRFDFRSVLFAYTIVYLDQDIAISTIFLLGVGRYFFGDLGLSTMNLIISLVYIATNLAIFDYIKAKYSTFFQLWLLTMLAIVVAVPISYIRLDSTTLTLSAYLLQAAVSSVFIYITYHFTSDLDKLYDSSVQDSLTALYNARKLEENLEKFLFTTDFSY